MEKNLILIIDKPELRLESIDEYDSCEVINTDYMRHVYMLGKVIRENLEKFINFDGDTFYQYDFRGHTYEFCISDKKEEKDFLFKLVITHKGFVFIEAYNNGVLKACDFTDFVLFEGYQMLYFETLYNRVMIKNRYASYRYYIESLICNISKTGYNLNSIPDCRCKLDNKVFTQMVKKLIISSKGSDKLQDYLPVEYTWSCKDKNMLVHLGTDSLFTYEEVDEELNMATSVAYKESMCYLKQKMVGYQFLADDVILFTSQCLNFEYNTQVLYVRGYVFFLRGSTDLMFAWKKFPRQAENRVSVFDTGKVYVEGKVIAVEIPVTKCEYLQPYYLSGISVDEFISLTPYLYSGLVGDRKNIVRIIEDLLGRKVSVIPNGKMASAMALGEINFPKLNGQVFKV